VLFPVYDQAVLPDFDRFLVAPVDRVVLEQVGQVFRGSDIIDRRHLQAARIQDDLEGGPTNPAKPVNRYFCHRFLLSMTKLKLLVTATVQASSLNASGEESR